MYAMAMLKELTRVLIILNVAYVQTSPILENIITHSSLQLVHVIFRHGDRTPSHSYPTDPYINETYYPVGYGQLTNAGKLTTFRIGDELRHIYGGFLGSIYTPDLIQATSSSMSRCKTSLQLVLAALFPPTPIQSWTNNLNWQPIPYDYIPFKEDNMFWPTVTCPAYHYFDTEFKRIFEIDGHLAEYGTVYRYIKDVTNYTSTNPGMAITSIHATLLAQQEWGLILPPWTQTIWPEPLSRLTGLVWAEFNRSSDKVRTLIAGVLMAKILKDTRDHIEGRNSERKMYLYSAHDSNIVAVLCWLGVFHPHSPPYGAYITIEIHKIFEAYTIQIYYQNYGSGLPTPIVIPDCGTICPLTTFEKLYEKYLNADELCWEFNQ